MSEVFQQIKTALAERYAVERELGSGGMAIVYLAHDRRHNRPVAVKVLRREIAAALGRERFLREIESALQPARPGQPRVGADASEGSTPLRSHQLLSLLLEAGVMFRWHLLPGFGS